MSAKSVVRLSRSLTSELLDWGRPHLFRGPVSILAGHFILAYSYARAQLVPLLASEFNGSGAEEPLLALARDFPETTFSYGLDLLLSFGDSRGKILLLVDDETVKYMQMLPDNLNLPELRKAYFRQETMPPLCYREALERRGLQIEEIFEPNITRRASSILPTNTYLFSEHILRTHFRRRTRKRLATMKGFQLREDPLTTSLVFERDGNNISNSSCVVEKGEEQTCSGTALALMEILRTRNYEHFVWFLPSGCRESVTRAVVLAVRELDWFSSALLIYETAIPGEEAIQLREGLFVGEIAE